MPAAKEEVGKEETSSVGSNVFSHEQHSESHTAVFGPPSFDQFRFCFRHIERNTFNFSDHGDEEQCASQWHQEDVPSTCSMLEVNAVDDVERSSEHSNCEKCQ